MLKLQGLINNLELTALLHELKKSNILIKRNVQVYSMALDHRFILISPRKETNQRKFGCFFLNTKRRNQKGEIRTSILRTSKLIRTGPYMHHLTFEW